MTLTILFGFTMPLTFFVLRFLVSDLGEAAGSKIGPTANNTSPNSTVAVTNSTGGLTNSTASTNVTIATNATTLNE